MNEFGEEFFLVKDQNPANQSAGSVEKNRILAARNGDHEAFNALWEQYRPMVFKTVFLYCRSDAARTEADDLRQEASIALYDAVKSFDVSQDRITFGLYAKRCVTNRIISALRKLKKHRSDGEEPILSDESPDPLEEIIDRESYEALVKKIEGALSGYEKAVYDLHVEGKSCREIASALKRSEKSVGNAMCRIRSKLESIL
ncbi:MAG: sigma-70 family RNA polymerase sigma factor [Ruminococcaceae bacterium]|nr:sigma-70 family RNA polymerase sigma factor [Oscillospiraceae bacterium]